MKFSIVTINYNNLEGLKKTIESVFIQNFNDFEYIIIDGGSSDGSRGLIESISDRLSFWVSEKDNGIYNAMNKGILNAKGDYLLFLNSGDHLNNSTVLKTVAGFLKKDIVYGNLLITNKNKEQGKAVYPSRLSFNFFATLSLPHPGSFIKKELFKRVGHYDETLAICADWKFFIDAVCKHKCSYKYINIIISDFYEDGLSSKKESDAIILNERKDVLENNYPEFYKKSKYSIPNNEQIKNKFHFSSIIDIFKSIRK